VADRKEEGIRLIKDFRTGFPNSEYLPKIDKLLETAEAK
jgi:hypothetical protein